MEFNASNLPSGIYFYRLETSDLIQTKKMLLLK
ncbi:MAG TPA: T9SS type A sorting domain-containing protein [Ignavibacteriaceae bacterium]